MSDQELNDAILVVLRKHTKTGPFQPGGDGKLGNLPGGALALQKEQSIAKRGNPPAKPFRFQFQRHFLSKPAFNFDCDDR